LYYKAAIDIIFFNLFLAMAAIYNVWGIGLSNTILKRDHPSTIYQLGSVISEEKM
jgi:hypothetical protein